MKLEINKKHKKINLKDIKTRNQVSSTLMSTVLALTLFSGCSKMPDLNQNINNNEATISEEIEETKPELFTYNKKDDVELQEKISSILNDDIVYVPNNLKSTIDSSFNKDSIITKSVLEKVRELNISTNGISKSEDLLWLNYCTNMDTLIISVFDDSFLNCISTLPNLERLAIYNAGSNSKTLDNNNCKLLFSPKLNYLVIRSFNLQKGLIESLTNLDYLDISSSNNVVLVNYDLDYERLTHLKSLIVGNPYSVAVHLGTNDLNILLDNNIEIIDRNRNDMAPILKEINDKLDNIVLSLNINENSSDEEKLDAIIMYVITNLKYDPNVIEKLQDSKGVDATSFYEHGNLYGALELDYAICGNYSALVSALCERVNLNEINQMSSNHSWNLVYVDGNNYYVDSTLIDNTINDENNLNEIKESEWYLIDPNKEIDSSHIVMNLSDMLTIEPITVNTEESYDISNNEYKLTINKKEYIISAGVLLGILSGLGLAYEVKKKNDELEDLNQLKR